jgi:hypothetical protein
MASSGSLHDYSNECGSITFDGNESVEGGALSRRNTIRIAATIAKRPAVQAKG